MIHLIEFSIKNLI